MKLFGSIKELVSAVFRKNSQEITLRPNQTTTYTAARDVQLPEQDSNAVIVSRNSVDTLTNKTIDGDDNTVQDLAITSLKTVLGDANKVLRRDGSGVPQSGNSIPNTSALVTTDATQTLTGKGIDGDDNTVTDLAITALKTVLGDANKVLRRDASGIPQSGNSIPNASEIVTTDATQALSNKTIDGDLNTVQDLPETAIKTNLTNASKFFTRDASGIPESATKAVPSGAVVGTSDSQTLTNKILTSPELDTPLVDDYAEFNEESAPSTPASGKVRMYAKTDGRFYGKDDAGTEFSLGGGGASESITTVTNSDATVTDGDGFTTFLFSTGNTNRTLTLPTAADNQNRRIRIKKIDSGTGTVIIDGEGSETIDDAATQTLFKQFASVTVQCDGTEWHIVAAEWERGTFTVPALGAGLTNVGNLQASGGGILYFARQGNIVHISGNIEVDALSSSTLTQFKFSPPIPSAFTSSADCTGCITVFQGATFDVGRVNANSADDTLAFVYYATSTSASDLFFEATYVIKS